ncbi:DUF294 nucleotidyltransferase-like domain-containing protein [Desulfobotulus sp. H1]|uniref:DUF294 nucleotidyltransferase-like domain-containing protein n=1 Tax=Desulfobotulus pelophilus TaxID=2823377 RepID=A0ABT3N5G4_9BACT|nr:putative nucleotidyltransferase substrate binding domain-containing protein [Desulfobotulus pelophilus]MCW7752698.1 DUF294 nucleotidyltransferase-like domain-containing protein [Desulfobotulus pelophilus]
MEVELVDIADHMQRFEPFCDLPAEEVLALSGHVDVRYFKAGSTILTSGEPIHEIYFIRSGAVEVFRRNGTLYNRLEEGAVFGQMSLLVQNRVRFPAKSLEDTLLYLIPEKIFRDLCDRFDVFADFVEIGGQTRLRQAVSRAQELNDVMRTRIQKLLTRELVSIDASATVVDAAGKMTEESVSCLLITDRAYGSGSGMAGIVTDRDLRTRFVAVGLSSDTPVSEIMSRELVTVEAQQYVFEAMLCMLRFNIHHLPVMRNKQCIGMISISDLIRYESQNSLLVVARILRAQDTDELVRMKAEIESSFVRMVNEGANSHMVGSAMSIFGRSIKQRLMELAEEQFGPSPVPCCLMAMGSMARDELLPGGDQDNALILDDSYDEDQHGEYFDCLTRFVCDGLAACGYPYCTGGIMAKEKKWRQPLAVWRTYFNQWMDNPTHEALLHSSIFFDLDGVWGELQWVEQLKEEIARKAKNSRKFLSCLARNALSRTPPLGFFKDFVVEVDGKHKNVLDLKRRGSAPLVALIRVYALAIGSTAQNSFERLDDIRETKLLPPGSAETLHDAMEFISMVRLRSQAHSLQQGLEVNNKVNPENLSRFDRRNLKEAFQVVSNAQKFIRFRY